MKQRTLHGATGWVLVAMATMTLGMWSTTAIAQAPGAAPAAAPAAPGAQPGAGLGPTQPAADPFTLENLIGDSVSLSNQQYPEVTKALERFKNSDPEGAREYLVQAKLKYPKLPPVDLLMAKLWVYGRNGEQARALLEAAVTNQPNDPEAYLLLADLAFAEGRVTEAHALFEKANTLVQGFAENPKRQQNFKIRVLAGLSAVHERRQQWDQASKLLAEWVKLDPDSSAAHTRMGITLFRLKKQADAFAEFKKARELKADSSHPYVVMGQLYTQEGNLDNARKSFEQAYKEDQKNENTARAYAEWLIQQSEFDKAQQVAAAMRKAAPNSISALMLDGVIAMMRKQPQAAEEALTKVLTIDVTNAGATNLLALLLADSTNPAQQEKALGYAQMNAQRFPNNSQANITLAWVLTKLNRGTDADAFLQRAVAGQQINADSAYLVARIMMEKNQKDNARKALEQVLQQAGTGMFMYRKQAEALLKELGGTVPQPPGATAKPAAGAASAAPAPASPAAATTPGAQPTPVQTARP
jgi:Tfp pilus assembly protein PilF